MRFLCLSLFSVPVFLFHVRELLLLLEEQLLEDLDRVFRASDGMADRPWIRKDFVIVTTFVSLITKEMNSIKPFLLDQFKRVSLIPALGEDIE